MRFDKYTYTEVLLLAVLLLTACTEAVIYYPGGTVEPPVTEGYVRIYPDNSEHTLPAVVYHFYSTNANQEYIIRACDGVGNFEGSLPEGTYRVIATNTSAQNVEFTGMDNHETAAVTALPITARSSAQQMVNGKRSMVNYYLAQPGEVYSTVMSELTVTPADTLRYEPLPVLLTRQLKLVFTLQGSLSDEVFALNGVLRGIYPSVLLYSCGPTQESVRQSPDMSITFDTEVQGSQRQAYISLFGLCDPDYGHVYTNEMPLELTMKDGSKQQITFDLTDVLSDVISQNQGTIPIEFTLPIDIKRVGIGLEGVVTGWINEGETEIDK